MNPIKELIALLDQQYDKPDGYKVYTEFLNKLTATQVIEWDLWCLVAYFSTKKDLTGIIPEFLMAIGESFYTAGLTPPKVSWQPSKALDSEIYCCQPFPGIPSIAARKVQDVAIVFDRNNLIAQLKKLTNQESCKLEALFALVSFQEFQLSGTVLTQEELLSYQTKLSAKIENVEEQPRAYALRKHVLACISYFIERETDQNFPEDANTHSYIVDKFSKAAEWYATAAKNGDAWCQYMLGYCLSFVPKPIVAEVENKDQASAKENNHLVFTWAPWFEKAAIQGHIRSQYRVAELEEGLMKRTQWHMKAAQQGCAASMYKLARYSEGTHKEFWLLKAAAQGNLMAKFELAVHYIGPKSITSAIRTLKELADHNDDAKFLLGAIYYEGIDIYYKDPASAVQWFTLAADNNHAKAQLYLGRCYRDGYGVTKDLDQAISWYEKSSHKLIDACTELGKLYLIEKRNPELAFKYLEKTTKGVQSNEALYFLGNCYEWGIGTKKNLSEAIKCYDKITNRQPDHAEATEALRRLRTEQEVDQASVRTLGM